MSVEASARPSADPGRNPNHPAASAQGGQVDRYVALSWILEQDRKIAKKRIFELLGVGSQSSFKRIKAQLAHAGLPLTYSHADKHFHAPPSASIALYGIDPRARA